MIATPIPVRLASLENTQRVLEGSYKVTQGHPEAGHNGTTIYSLSDSHYLFHSPCQLPLFSFF